MRTTATFQIGRICGRCGKDLPAGSPVIIIRVTGIKREFVRCQACAADERIDKRKK
jgi:hypothetical protein